MSNKGLRIVWFNLRTEKCKHFHLAFPISFNVFRELLDSMLDLMTLMCVFAPKAPSSGSHMSVHAVKKLVRMLLELFGSITDDGPYDLVDVAADNVKVSIKIR